ncbi:hypothetical protein Taro_034982 [Colocasia esculenta]|uniref:Uncharacterized protein n=1 Tax=Colocasia esculenta TaxID=4460 RepID=A0A843WDI1_COLES|nr:hypothetical protein [Colocasia esculenta]
MRWCRVGGARCDSHSCCSELVGRVLVAPWFSVASCCHARSTGRDSVLSCCAVRSSDACQGGRSSVSDGLQRRLWHRVLSAVVRASVVFGSVGGGATLGVPGEGSERSGRYIPGSPFLLTSSSEGWEFPTTWSAINPQDEAFRPPADMSSAELSDFDSLQAVSVPDLREPSADLFELIRRADIAMDELADYRSLAAQRFAAGRGKKKAPREKRPAEEVDVQIVEPPVPSVVAAPPSASITREAEKTSK